MITTAESPRSIKKIHYDVRSRTTFPVQEIPVLPPARVPAETRIAMRPQPTPVLISPFRWVGWTILHKAFVGFVRITRLATGLKRD
jgi:hypothetical protein